MLYSCSDCCITESRLIAFSTAPSGFTQMIAPAGCLYEIGFFKCVRIISSPATLILCY